MSSVRRSISRVSSRLFGRRGTGLGFVLIAGLVAASPVIVSTFHAISAQWTPSSDDGVIALRAFDVISAHPPLLGQYTSTSYIASTPAYSLGPLLYWVLTLPAHVGPAAIVLTMGAVNTMSIMGAVALARRRGGPPLAVGTALALVVTLRSLPVEIPYEVWNCWAGLLPFTALLFVAWSVACGEVELLPALALIGSYVVQCHLTYLVPTVSATAIALLGLGLSKRSMPASVDQERRRRSRRWIVGAVVVFVLCWSAPVVEQIGHRPGNFVLAVRLSHHRTFGDAAGFNAVTRAVGLPPLWAQDAPGLAKRILDVVYRPAWPTVATAVAIFALLIGTVVVALRRRRHDLAAAAILGLALCLSFWLVARSLPNGGLGLQSTLYVLMWGSPLGMFVALILAWSAWSLFGPSLSFGTTAIRTVRFAGCMTAAVIAMLIAFRGGPFPERLPPGLKNLAEVRSTTARAVDRLDRRSRVLIDVPAGISATGLTFQSAVAYELRRRGVSFAVPPRLAREMGDQYCPNAGPYDEVLVIANADARPEPGTRLLARSPDVTLSLARPPSTAGRQHEAHARQDEGRDAPSHCPMSG